VFRRGGFQTRSTRISRSLALGVIRRSWWFLESFSLRSECLRSPTPPYAAGMSQHLIIPRGNQAATLFIRPHLSRPDRLIPHGDRCGQLSLAPHFVQKAADEEFCVPQVGQSFIPSWNGVVDPIGIWPGGGCEILARLE